MELVTKEIIVRDLRALGIVSGMRVIVHSSLKSFGQVEAGPKTIVDALMEVVTEEGILLFPSFNHATAFELGAPGYYSSKETRTIDGAIPDYFWRQPGVLRTIDPSHPFAAWGKQAREFLKDHHRNITMSAESPLGRLWRSDGYALLLGVHYGPNTFKHVTEMTNNVPCLGARTEAYLVKLPDGRTVLGRTWGWREKNCPISEPGRHLQGEMERRGLHVKGNVAAANSILFKLDDCYKVLSEMLAKGFAGFPPCSACSIRPRHCAATVESDWDFEHNCLRPDSLAWTYEDGL
ncbi:MAG: AAC(3) family N-acetyltransferase [Planctomycetota bacterium]